MRLLRNSNRWPLLFAASALCVLLGLSYGCSTSGEKAEFKPGSERIEDIRDLVRKNIEDPDKKTDILALVDQGEKELLELDRVILKLYADLGALNENYNSTPDDYQRVISGFEAGHKKVRDRIVDNRFKIRDLSTAEEWKKLSDTRKRKGLYKQSIRQPGQ